MQYKWTVLTVTTVGVLMSGIDGRIMIVGLPTVAAALHADAEQAIWFTQAYTIGSTIALLFIGRVSDMFGKVKIYAAGFTVFMVGSLLTALSGTPNAFIAARMLQGLGSAALFTNSAAIITDAFETKQLGTALGINQIAFRAGGMAGLTLSGVILAFLAWPFLFYINVPIGLFGTVWALRRLKDVRKRQVVPPMDWTGFATFTIFMACLLLAMTYAAYGFGEFWLAVPLLIASLASLWLFVRTERRKDHPLLDLELLKIREFTGGIITGLLNSMAWGSFMLIISLYFQLVQGYSPFQAGIAILPFDVAFLALGPVSGRYSDKYGKRPFTTAGLVVISLALFLSSTLGVSTPYAPLALYLAIGGAGLGLFASPNMSSVMGSVPAKRRAVASALRATFFNVGYTLSVNLVILIMTIDLPLATITQIISATTPTALTIAERTAFAAAINHVYIAMAIINAIAIVPNLLRGSRKEIEFEEVVAVPAERAVQ
ncbi:MAG TPA: MFS transporter [Nitrososphaerales archaeon]|nr:MFS transporter [Nitrososphaerales archaeon]